MKLLFGTEATNFLHENKIIRKEFTTCDKAMKIEEVDKNDFFFMKKCTRIIQCNNRLFFMVKDDSNIYCQSCNPFYDHGETEDNIVMWIQTTPCNENDEDWCGFTYAEKAAQKERMRFAKTDKK